MSLSDHKIFSSNSAVPPHCLIFGFGLMMLFVGGSIGNWVGPTSQEAEIVLTIILGTLFLSFVGGNGVAPVLAKYPPRRASSLLPSWSMY